MATVSPVLTHVGGQEYKLNTHAPIPQILQVDDNFFHSKAAVTEYVDQHSADFDDGKHRVFGFYDHGNRVIAEAFRVGSQVLIDRLPYQRTNPQAPSESKLYVLPA
ncbi:MAG TPA: hypothetical protein VEA59_04950 [Patescibacteria group bacterium]|nr:hypothetical protein [Patescibacteria group bacterium]